MFLHFKEVWSHEFTWLLYEKGSFGLLKLCLSGALYGNLMVKKIPSRESYCSLYKPYDLFQTGFANLLNAFSNRKCNKPVMPLTGEKVF